MGCLLPRTPATQMYAADCVYLLAHCVLAAVQQNATIDEMFAGLWVMWWWWNKAVFASNEDAKILRCLRLNWTRLPYANEECKSLAHAINCWHTVAQVSAVHRQWNNVFIFTTQFSSYFSGRSARARARLCVRLHYLFAATAAWKAMGYMLIAF